MNGRPERRRWQLIFAATVCVTAFVAVGCERAIGQDSATATAKAVEKDVNVAIYLLQARPDAASIFEFLNTADCVKPSMSAEDFCSILVDACEATGDSADEAKVRRIKYITVQGHVYADMGGDELLSGEQLASLQALMGEDAYILYLVCTAFETAYRGPAQMAQLLAARGGTFAGSVGSTAGVYNYFGPDGAPLLNAGGAIYQRGDPTMPQDWPQYFAFKYDDLLEALDDGSGLEQAELGRAAIFAEEDLRRLRRLRADRPEFAVSGAMYPVDSASESNNMPLVRMHIPQGHSPEQITADMDYVQRIMTAKYPNITADDLVLPYHDAPGHQ